MTDRETTGSDQAASRTHSFDIGDVVHDREDPDPSRAIVINTPSATCEEWDAYYNPRKERAITVAEDNPDYDASANVVVVAFEEDLDATGMDWEPSDGPISLANLGCEHYSFPPGRLEIIDPIATGEDDADPEPDSSGGPDTETETETEADDDSETPDNAPAEQDDPEAAAESEDDEDEDTGADTDPTPDPPTVSGEFADLRDRLEESASVEVKRDQDEVKLVVSKLGTSYEIARDGTITGEGPLRSRLDDIVKEYLGDPVPA